MEAFLRIMVHNQALVTDELVDERFAAAERTGVVGRDAGDGPVVLTPDTYEEGCSGASVPACGSGCCSSGAAKTGQPARAGRCWR